MRKLEKRKKRAKKKNEALTEIIESILKLRNMNVKRETK